MRERERERERKRDINRENEVTDAFISSFKEKSRSQIYFMYTERERSYLHFCFLCARIYLFLSLVDIVSYFEMKNINKSL